jgi:hypothetical protein
MSVSIERAKKIQRSTEIKLISNSYGDSHRSPSNHQQSKG